MNETLIYLLLTLGYTLIWGHYVRAVRRGERRLATTLLSALGSSTSTLPGRAFWSEARQAELSPDEHWT